MDDEDFAAWFAELIGGPPGVQAVALGGSRAAGTASPSSDWDFALYYRGWFDPQAVRALGFDGTVTEIGGWGGGVMNGGAWLTVDGRSVDLLFRDLDDIDLRLREAEAGQFQKEALLFYVACIPTYTVVAELAVGSVLVGELPRPGYPEALSRQAGRRWREDAALSISYARRALVERHDPVVAVANGSRALIELAHARAALDKRWVLNEKGLVEASGLRPLGEQLTYASDAAALTRALDAIEAVVAQQDLSTE